MRILGRVAHTVKPGIVSNPLRRVLTREYADAISEDASHPLANGALECSSAASVMLASHRQAVVNGDGQRDATASGNGFDRTSITHRPAPFLLSERWRNVDEDPRTDRPFDRRAGFTAVRRFPHNAPQARTARTD